MPIPLVCGACGTEILLLFLFRAIGVPDPVTFTLLGVFAASLGFWFAGIIRTDKIYFGKKVVLQKRAYNIRGLKIIMVLLMFALFIMGYKMAGMV